jgi:hypothetical protein
VILVTNVVYALRVRFVRMLAKAALA